MARIAQIYAVEKDVRGARADERRAVRQARSRPVVDALKMFFEHQLTRLAGGSETAKIIRYGLRHWDGLTRFLDDGRIGVSNEGHAVMSVKVRPEPKDSGSEAREAPWRESKTAEPSDNILERSMREASGCNVQ